MSKEENLEKIKDFFKSNVIIDDLQETLTFKPETLIGIDKISSDKLVENGIKTIEDLANLNPGDPPSVPDVMPQMIVKWIKIAKVLVNSIREQIKEQKKILLIGLDNSGKSSILAVLQDKFSIIKNLLPTRGVKREKLDFFGFPIISWDLGGQVQYRENLYFNKPELFFAEVDIILYVIDSQDPERFTEAVAYFKKVLNVLKELNEVPKILVVLHKSDQDVRKTLQWQKNITSVKNKINLVMEDFKEFDVDFYDTTIFQKETIMQMFSLALKKISDTSEIIENILEDFLIQADGRAISLISMDGLIFGSYTKNETDEMLINNTALLLQTLSNFHTSIGLKRESVIELKLPTNNFTIVGQKLYEYSELDIPVYLWFLAADTSKLNEKIDYFREQLVPLINMFV
ncbi:MAG: ADP-ribosylation factor-like protein [Promethearchaeota archaeon]